MRKDIHSDHDILEEEIIKPIKFKSYSSSTDNLSTNLVSEDLQNAQTYQEPSVPQLIKYKQQIRTENDRRLHREKLAEVAKTQREKEDIFQSDLSLKSEEIQQQNLIDGESQIVPSTNLSNKPIIKSKEEEEILNDENQFQSRQNRYRERPRYKSSTPYMREMKKSDENKICKVCGNVINEGNNQPLLVDSQKNFGKFIYFKNIKIKSNFFFLTAYLSQGQPSNQSIETSSGAADDWFESESSPWAPDDAITPPPIGSSTFRRSLFQPINDDIVEHRPPIRPLIHTDDDVPKTKRSMTPRISESGFFYKIT